MYSLAGWIELWYSSKYQLLLVLALKISVVKLYSIVSLSSYKLMNFNSDHTVSSIIHSHLFANSLDFVIEPIQVEDFVCEQSNSCNNCKVVITLSNFWLNTCIAANHSNSCNMLVNYIWNTCFVENLLRTCRELDFQVREHIVNEYWDFSISIWS